ncbi:dihydrolipoyl dehydrogenase [Tistrella sp. BH-R2-4]|uniref:Dihydrolipoyl dehydrogenase n=1 Tax=Tistrella arctica TaxID=3133430 RepID=A0ABU9YF25_9PROT
MPIKVLMPALSPTMTEGTLARWMVKEGDMVESGQVIAEIETDKATMEVESADEGVMARILVPDGTEGVAVNSLIAVLAEEGEDPKAAAAALSGGDAPKPEPKPVAKPEPRPAPKAEAKPAAKVGPKPAPKAAAKPAGSGKSGDDYDVAIIGGGPGGYVAAIRAGQLGLRTVVIEEKHLGGICLNWGCIPTKALLRASEVWTLINHARDFGISVEKPSFDLAAIVKRSRDVAKTLSQGVAHLLKKNKVEVIDGRGRLKGPGKVEVDGAKGKRSITADHIILATGARPRIVKGLEPDGERIWTYREAMVPESLPKSLLVVGSGAIGIEFASFYRALGVEVTVVELLDRILPVEDEEISAMARKAFEKQGIKILTGTQVKGLDKGRDGVSARLEDAKGKAQTLKVDRVIVAIGIVGNTDDLGLETTKVEVDRGQIKVGPYLETAEPGIYAIGDVAGAPWLAHKASHEGVICVEALAGGENVHPMTRENIPGCTYATPQVASVGLTEAKAKETGREIKVGRFPYRGNGKALAMGEPEGMVKTIFDAATGELLGAHMIGAEVTELIQGYVVAKSMEGTELDLIHAIFPHPTLSEMMHESVLDAFGRAIHF